MIESSTTNLGERVNAVIDYLELNFRGESLRSANIFGSVPVPGANPSAKLATYLSERNMATDIKDPSQDTDKFAAFRLPVSPTSTSKQLPIIREDRESVEKHPKSEDWSAFQNQGLLAISGSKMNLDHDNDIKHSADSHSLQINTSLPIHGSAGSKMSHDKPRTLQLLSHSREQSQPHKDTRRSHQIQRDIQSVMQKPREHQLSNPYGFPVSQIQGDAVYHDSDNHYAREYAVRRAFIAGSADKADAVPPEHNLGLRQNSNLAIIDFEEHAPDGQPTYHRKQSASIAINPQSIVANFAPISPVEKLSLRSRLDERFARGEYKERHSLLVPSRDPSRESRPVFAMARLPSPTNQTSSKLERGSSISYVNRDSMLNSAFKDSLQAVSGYLGSETTSPKASNQKDSTVDRIIEAQPLAKLSFSEPLTQTLQRAGIQLNARDLGSQRSTAKQSVLVSGVGTGTAGLAAQGSARSGNVPNLKLSGISGGKPDGTVQKETNTNLEHLISYRKSKQDSTRDPKRDPHRDHTASERIKDRNHGRELHGVAATSTQIQPRKTNVMTKQMREDNQFADVIIDRNLLHRIDSKEENENSNADPSDSSTTQIAISQHMLQHCRPGSKQGVTSLISGGNHPNRRESRDFKNPSWLGAQGIELHAQLAARGQRSTNQSNYLGGGPQLQNQIHKFPRDSKYRQGQPGVQYDSGRELPGQRYFDYKDTKPIYNDLYQSNKSRPLVTGLGQDFSVAHATGLVLGNKKSTTAGLYPQSHLTAFSGLGPKASGYDSLLRSGTMQKDLLGGQLSKHLNLGSRKTTEVMSKHGRNSSNHYDTSRPQNLGQLAGERRRDFAQAHKHIGPSIDDPAYRKPYVGSANSVKPGRY